MTKEIHNKHANGAIPIPEGNTIFGPNRAANPGAIGANTISPIAIGNRYKQKEKVLPQPVTIVKLITKQMPLQTLS